MARKVKDRELDTRAAREKLKARGKPYWRTVEPGLHLGYRRLKGRAGSWSLRRYLGDQKYELDVIGVADDLSDADGVAILSYWHAVEKARSAMVTNAQVVGGKGGPYTVNDAMADYFKFVEAKRKPMRTVRSHHRVFIQPHLGSIEVENLTTSKIESWRDSIANGKAHVRTAEGMPQQFKEIDEDEDEEEVARRRQATANRILTTLKAALNRAWERDRVNCSDKAWRAVKPFEGADAARVRYLTIDESKRLINACQTDFRKLVQGALQSGARYGQLARVVVSDFNPDNGTLRLITRKGDGKLKVFHAVLSDEGQQFFKHACAGLGPRARIFLNDGEQWGDSDQTRPMADACGAARIDPPIGFHILRHTWASHAVMNGVPLLVVAKNMGHSDTRMVEKHYGHLAPSYIAEAIRAGAPRFGFKPDGKVAVL